MQSTLDDRFRKIEERLEVLEKALKSYGTTNQVKREIGPIGTKELLSLPDSLRKTMIAIQDLNEATTEEVSKSTYRTRSVETIYLNQLVRIGYLQKLRKGRKIFFKVMEYY